MPPVWLDSFAALAIGTALRQLLELDPAGRAQAKGLSGSSLALTLEPGPIHVTLAFDETGARVEPGHGAPADASVQLDPAAVARLLAEGSEQAGAGGAHIKGDAVFAAAVLDLLRGLRPDLLAPLAKVFGTESAHVVGEAAQRAGRGLRGGVDAGMLRAQAWLTAPMEGWLPGRSEIARFLDEVDELRLATDRLEARIRRLELHGRTGAES